MKLTFFGGAGTVTGSKLLVESNHKKILIDCGLFQGLKELRLKNRELLPINLEQLDAIILTHAHLDHCGYLPILIKNGYNKTIYCTEPTKYLTKIILLDSAKIQEEDTKRANKYQYTKHKPAEPLYTVDDAKETINHLQSFNLDEWHIIDNEIKFKFINSGHILGSAIIILQINDKTLVFSGDLGRENPILLKKYEYVDTADYLIIESTYGNRLHEKVDIGEELLKHINYTYQKKGILVIPSFSVERAQEIIYLLSILKQKKLLPKIPIYLDSPMGVSATEVYYNHQEYHTLTNEEIKNMMSTVHLISDINESKSIVNDKNPKIVIAGSGMITGGRVLHYLDKLISDKKNSVLIVGFQAEGTRGKALLAGDSEIKFFGKYHQINADIFKINAFSGHADQSELLDWLNHFKTPPKLTIINHGEPHQSQAFKTKIKSKLNWNCTVAKINKEYNLE